MPIKPENLQRYPKEWPQIVARVRARARNKCEQCGVSNHALGGRTRNGAFLTALPKGEVRLRLEWPSPGEHWWCGRIDQPALLRIIRIVCTVAHLDHTPENCADDNLRFWCQRCHLQYDRALHAQHAYETRRAGRAIDLFPEELAVMTNADAKLCGADWKRRGDFAIVATAHTDYEEKEARTHE